MFAELTRRSLLAGAARASPAVAAAFGPARHVGCLRNAWDRALDDYGAARRRHEDFLADVLDPEVRLARSQGRGLNARIARLEDRGNDLCTARHEALHALILVPARDCEALRVKFRLAYEDIWGFEDDHGYIAALLTDLERLLE